MSGIPRNFQEIVKKFSDVEGDEIMTVKELIEELSIYGDDTPVVLDAYTESAVYHPVQKVDELSCYQNEKGTRFEHVSTIRKTNSVDKSKEVVVLRLRMP